MPELIELSIRFTSHSDGENQNKPISVSLFRPDNGTSTAPVPFKLPPSNRMLNDLRWYLEVFSRWPIGPDSKRAEGIEVQMEPWGRALLQSVICDNKTSRLWQQFVDASADNKLLTVDATDPRVLRLPWELLADDEGGGHIFAQGISVRRRLQQATRSSIKPFALPVRILVVVSRPDDEKFIDSRHVSQPLLDALEELGNRVEVEFLYPPTIKALTARLRDRKALPVHVVHFDGHGKYDAKLGQGYLIFENGKHKSDPVDAHRLGTLLSRCGVPLMVLNACQSAKQQTTNPYDSVAARLIKAGVGSVLAMNYSVQVVAVKKFIATFYSALANGLTVGQAVDEGRLTLLADEERQPQTRREAQGELVEKTIRLRDWFVPALYQQAADPVVFELDTRHSDEEGIKSLPLALTNPRFLGGLPSEPRHGFHGRAREMLELERVLAERAIIVLHGFGGVGKTALVVEAARWFYRTGRFPGGVAFVSFEQGGSLWQLCSWVGQAVSGDFQFMAHPGDPVVNVKSLLDQEPALIILDNFESVLEPDPLMPPDELKAVLDAVWMWAQTSSRILITTRETRFNDIRFEPSKNCAHIELQGLAQNDALALAAAVLDNYKIDRATVELQELIELMEHLGGHPLSLYLALPHLRHYTPAELSAHFKQLLPDFTAGAAKGRNESLTVSLEFSLRRLDDETHTALLDLALFQGGCIESQLLDITQIAPNLWQSARAEIEQAALVTIDSLPDINSPFLRFHPTLIPYLATQLPSARRAKLEERYWRHYYNLANDLYQLDTQQPDQARTIALRELPNLRHALDLAIATAFSQKNDQITEAAVELATRIAQFLDYFGRWREQKVIITKIEPLAARGKAKYLEVSQKGNILRQQGRAAEAEQLFSKLLEQLDNNAAYDIAMTLRELGLCQQAQERPKQAIEYHRKALRAFESLNTSSRMIATCHVDLADNLAAMEQFDKAQQHYDTAKAIFQKVDDPRRTAAVQVQQGTLALRRNDLSKAKQQLSEAVKEFQVLHEPQSEASCWHHLGIIAWRGEDWDEAERCYREAARIRELIGDWPMLATDYNQLALIAKDAGRLDDAEHWYKSTIKYAEYLADQGAKVYMNLAILYRCQGRLDEAAHYGRQAAKIIEQHDIQPEVWRMYNVLAEIAEARGCAAEAVWWRYKALEKAAAYAEGPHPLPKWARPFAPIFLAPLAACKGIWSSRPRSSFRPICHSEG